jgi:hypothetical protein
VEATLLTLPLHRSRRRGVKDDLAPYEVNKGKIRFPLSEPVPVKLIEDIPKFRAKEVAERENGEGGRVEEALGPRHGANPDMLFERGRRCQHLVVRTHRLYDTPHRRLRGLLQIRLCVI